MDYFRVQDYKLAESVANDLSDLAADDTQVVI